MIWNSLHSGLILNVLRDKIMRFVILNTCKFSFIINIFFFFLNVNPR